MPWMCGVGEVQRIRKCLSRKRSYKGYYERKSSSYIQRSRFSQR